MVKVIAKKRQSVATSNYSNFESWARVTGLHGALDFYYAQSPLMKIIWALIISLGCFFAINQCILLISDYSMNSQWLTSVSYEKPSTGSIPWPNLTICALNWLQQDKLNNYGYDGDAEYAYGTYMDDGFEFYHKWQGNETLNITEYTNMAEYMHEKSRRIMSEMANKSNIQSPLQV